MAEWKKILLTGDAASAFTELTDVPSSYVGAEGQALRVNTGGTGLEFYTPSDTDEKVKSWTGDTSSGYLDSKVDGVTLEVDTASSTMNVKDGGITTAKLSDGAVTSIKISDGSIVNSKLATDSVFTINITDGAVTTAKISDSSIVESKLADNSVTNAKITDGAVTTAKISDSSVTTGKLNIDANVDFNGFQSLDWGVETVSALTSSVVTSSEFVGRIVFNNADSRPYMYI